MKRHLAITALLLLAIIHMASACDNSHCTPANPCNGVYSSDFVDYNCFHLDRVMQIIYLLPFYRVDGDPQFKQINMLPPYGMDHWPSNIYKHICNISVSGNNPVPATLYELNSTHTNCWAWRETNETYLELKNRQLNQHDYYEILAFFYFVGIQLREHTRVHPNTPRAYAYQALCSPSGGLKDVWGSPNLWSTARSTNKNVYNNSYTGTKNPFPTDKNDTAYDDQSKLYAFINLAALPFTSYAEAMYDLIGDLSECLPLNYTKYEPN